MTLSITHTGHGFEAISPAAISPAPQAPKGEAPKPPGLSPSESRLVRLALSPNAGSRERQIRDEARRALSPSIYKGPTRPLTGGFDEEAMYAQFQKLPAARHLAAQMEKAGFRYVGDTGSASKANTDFDLKTIRINKNLSPKEAALSLAYELRNASQAEEFGKILGLLKKEGTPELAHAYAEGILRKEAKSVLIRSQMAIALDCPELIKNPRYNQIANDNSLSDLEKEEAIFKEMKENGTVHQGKKKAYDHYVAQFWQYNKVERSEPFNG